MPLVTLGLNFAGLHCLKRGRRISKIAKFLIHETVKDLSLSLGRKTLHPTSNVGHEMFLQA